MWLRRASMAVLSLGVLAASAGASWHPDPSWELKPTRASTARLRGLDVVTSKVVWASGCEGTVIRTTDGGRSWSSVGPPDTAALQFRDIEAFDAPARGGAVDRRGRGLPDLPHLRRRRAPGPRRSATTTRRASTTAWPSSTTATGWRSPTRSTASSASSPPATAAGPGRSCPTAGMPAALAGEFAFAASGTCLVTPTGGRRAWFATGGGATARVFATDNRGRTWRVTDTPVPSGPSAGIYSPGLPRPRGTASRWAATSPPRRRRRTAPRPPATAAAPG